LYSPKDRAQIATKHEEWKITKIGPKNRKKENLRISGKGMDFGQNHNNDVMD
jgi:hypothetical protein